MAYLIPRDYQVNIQDVNIQQIISADESVRDRAQLSGEAEAKSYLKQKYYIGREFQDMSPFSMSQTYFPFQRFYLDAAPYNTATSYGAGNLVLYSGNIYSCTGSTTGPFAPANWELYGAQYAIFTFKLPNPEFNYNSFYNVNDLVVWNNRNYKCRVQTAALVHETALQYRTIENLPLQNIAPDDPISGAAYWQNMSACSVGGTKPTDTTKFTKSDDRDAQMVLYLCDIVLYHLHSRIAPRNIPELRVKRYDDAIAWLKMCADGSITPNLPLIQPKQGSRIRYGGNIKQINSY